MGVTPNIGRFDPIYSSCGTHRCFVFVSATPQSRHLIENWCSVPASAAPTKSELVLALKRPLLTYGLPVIRKCSRPVGGFTFRSEGTTGQPKRYFCMVDEKKKMSLEIWCDLLEAELKRALEDLSEIRGLDKAQARSKSHMLRAALNNAQQYFREIQDSPNRP